jgi:hypothetical protein
MELAISWAPSKQVPDCMAELELNQIRSDSDGKVYSLGDSGSRHVTRYTFTVRDLPPRRVKTLSVRVKVREEAYSLKQTQWFRHFLFKLELPKLGPTRGLGQANAVAQADTITPQISALPAPLVVQTEGVAAELEGDSASNYELQARLWLRDAQDRPLPDRPSRDPHSKSQVLQRGESSALRQGSDVDPVHTWMVQEIIGRNAQGQTYASSWDPMSADRIYFKVDGSPALPYESSQPFRLSFSDGKKPEKLSLEVKVKAARHRHAVFGFTKVPIPRAGETLVVNQELKAPNGVHLILRKVCSFTSTDQLPGVAGTLQGWHQIIPGSGLALVFEAVPEVSERGNVSLQHFFKVTQAHDEQRRKLHRHEYVKQSAGNALLSGPATPGWWTVYLMSPASDAKNFDVQAVLDELLPTGDMRTLTFSDVPLPAERIFYF